MPSILQRSDYEECLIFLYFGRNPDRLSLCREHAYRDFQRTLHGIGDSPKAEEAWKKADKTLNQALAKIQKVSACTQKKFDDWHRATCEDLNAVYRRHDYKTFYFGHAQKWVNMTFKYIYVMGEQRLHGFAHLYDLCHTPLDKILIGALEGYGFEPLNCPWSRLDDYETYLDRQHLRKRFKDAPLDVEFRLWMHPSSKLSVKCQP